jgi:hypothetical protein
VPPLNKTETSVVAISAILNPPGVAAPEPAECAQVETDGSPAQEAEAKPRKPRKRRVMQPRAPPLAVSQGCMEILEFCIWARVSRTTAFMEIKAGRLKVARIGRKPIVPVENAKAWLAALLAKAA